MRVELHLPEDQFPKWTRERVESMWNKTGEYEFPRYYFPVLPKVGEFFCFSDFFDEEDFVEEEKRNIDIGLTVDFILWCRDKKGVYVSIYLKYD